MFWRCSRSPANRLPPGPFACVAACLAGSSRASAAWLSRDISLLRFWQDCMSVYEVGDREHDQHERVKPEIGIAEALGEGADADRLKPARWKQQANESSRAGKGGDGHEQARKIHNGDRGKHRSREHGRNLGFGERRDELPETASRKDVEQGSEREGSKRSFDRYVENDQRHQHHEDERQHPDHDIGKQFTQEELEFADGRGPEMGYRACLLLAEYSDGRDDCRDQTQYNYDDARTHGEDAFESLVVAEAVFDI